MASVASAVSASLPVSEGWLFIEVVQEGFSWGGFGSDAAGRPCRCSFFIKAELPPINCRSDASSIQAEELKLPLKGLTFKGTARAT